MTNWLSVGCYPQLTYYYQVIILCEIVSWIQRVLN